MRSIGQVIWEPIKNASAFPEFEFALNTLTDQGGEGTTILVGRKDSK